MDKLEQLIGQLSEFKDFLNKNINMSYGSGEQNMSNGAPEGALAQSEQSEQKVNANNPYNEQPKGNKSDDQRNDKNDKEPELEGPKNLKERKQPSVEKMEIAKNGQWSLKKDAVNPKLAPKEVKIKDLQHKIDTGVYKPDAKKIADKMLKHPEKPLK